jgi:hypothetical protein
MRSSLANEPVVANRPRVPPHQEGLLTTASLRRHDVHVCETIRQYIVMTTLVQRSAL